MPQHSRFVERGDVEGAQAGGKGRRHAWLIDGRLCVRCRWRCRCSWPCSAACLCWSLRASTAPQGSLPNPLCAYTWPPDLARCAAALTRCGRAYMRLAACHSPGRPLVLGIMRSLNVACSRADIMIAVAGEGISMYVGFLRRLLAGTAPMAAMSL